MYAMELTNPSTVTTGTGACTLAHKGARPGWAGTGGPVHRYRTGTGTGRAVGRTDINRVPSIKNARPFLA